MKHRHALLTVLLLALTACDDKSDTCQTRADCFAGEVCIAKECVEPADAGLGGDMPGDMVAGDMTMDMPDAELPDMAEDMPDAADMPADMAPNQPPNVTGVAIMPARVLLPGQPLTCAYSYIDPDGDPDRSLISWQVADQLTLQSEPFGEYVSGDVITCSVEASDGIHAPQPSLRAQAVTAPPPPILIASNTTCAVLDRSAWCWGKDASNLPTPVSELAAGISAIAAGASHRCAVQSGALKCWGVNSYGQLGINSLMDSTAPTLVTGLGSGVTAVSAGESHTCAIHQGALKCWGDNSAGQIGVGSAPYYNIPQFVAAQSVDFSAASAVSLGYQHTCAVRSGAAWCWGSNTYGQLGDGTTNDSLTPVQVTGLGSGVTAISAGDFHTCAIQDGAAKCWGQGIGGQLGQGVKQNASAPVGVLTLDAGVTDIGAGSGHSCALVGGAAWCWGENGLDQLGDGALSDSVLPIRIIELDAGASALAVGDNYACVFQRGAIRCWGSNNLGQLGDGTNNNSAIPVAAVLP